jgi:hypothetical protein
MANKILVLFLMLSLGCNPIRKAERKVLNNLESSERVFRELEKTRPCVNDTTLITKYDTTLLVDTIINYTRDTITIDGKEYITIFEQPKTIVKTVKVHEIKTGYIVDTRRLNLALDSVRYYKVNAHINKETSNKWMWRFWGLLGVLIGLITIKKLICRFQNI